MSGASGAAYHTAARAAFSAVATSPARTVRTSAAGADRGIGRKIIGIDTPALDGTRLETTPTIRTGRTPVSACAIRSWAPTMEVTEAPLRAANDSLTTADAGSCEAKGWPASRRTPIDSNHPPVTNPPRAALAASMPSDGIQY